MRRFALLLVALAIAPSSFASWWPWWTPKSLSLLVGEKATVKVEAKWSGLVDYGNGIHWTFASDSPQVATAFVQMSDSRARDVEVVAIRPGLAAIRELTQYGFGSVTWVLIEVTCGIELPVRSTVPPAQFGTIHKALTLSVVADAPGRTHFVWYSGREGDYSRPLDASGPVFDFTPDAYGTHYVWVLASTPCSMSTVEFRIDVPYPRRRAVR